MLLGLLMIKNIFKKTHENNRIPINIYNLKNVATFKVLSLHFSLALIL